MVVSLKLDPLCPLSIEVGPRKHRLGGLAALRAE
jgi:hypothetical protein